MKKIFIGIISGLAIASLAACSGEKTDSNFHLEKKTLTVVPWKYDGTQSETVKAKLTLNGKPVEGAEVETALKATKKTDKNGEVAILLNKDRILKKTVSVINADEAKIDGKTLSDKEKKSIVGLKDTLTIEYPISVQSVKSNEKDKTLVDVNGQVKLAKEQYYPTFVPSLYKIAGIVKDADGHPVKDATVNFRRDGVEGFTMSKPSNKNGEYELYYLPEDEEDHYMAVIYKNTVYTLPPNKVYNFPEDIGVTIDITLPKTGTVIADKPPTLVTKTAPGALYKGTLIGVNVPKNVKYTITIPKPDGTFTLTLPKSEWEKNPTFFETIYTNYLVQPKKSGDLIDSNFITKV